MQGAQFPSLVRALRSHIPGGMAKKKINKRKCLHTGPSLMNVSNFDYVKLHVLVSEGAFIERLL